MMEQCQQCTKDLVLYRHRFQNGEYHCKAVCKNCGYGIHVNRYCMTDDMPEYTQEVYAEMMRMRKAFKKAAVAAKRGKSFNCSSCGKHVPSANTKAHMRGVCTKRCLLPRQQQEPLLPPQPAIIHEPPKVSKRERHPIYDSRQWQHLRYKVLRQHGRKCMCCGTMGGEMHVDHVRPVSKYPELRFDINNLQVLCRDCNMGKGAWDHTDFRLRLVGDT